MLQNNTNTKRPLKFKHLKICCFRATLSREYNWRSKKLNDGCRYSTKLCFTVRTIERNPQTNFNVTD